MKKTILVASLFAAVATSGLMTSASAEVAAVFKMNTVGCAGREPLRTAEALRAIDDPAAITATLDKDIKAGKCKVFKGGDAVIIEANDPADRMNLVRLAGDNVSFWVHSSTMAR